MKGIHLTSLTHVKKNVQTQVNMNNIIGFNSWFEMETVST